MIYAALTHTNRTEVKNMHGLTASVRKNHSTLSFLHPGWWVLHAVAIVIVLTAGYCMSE